MAVTIFSPDMTKVMVINDDEYVTFPVSEHCDLSQIKDDKDVPQKKELMVLAFIVSEALIGSVPYDDVNEMMPYSGSVMRYLEPEALIGSVPYDDVNEMMPYSGSGMRYLEPRRKQWLRMKSANLGDEVKLASILRDILVKIID